MNLNFAGKTLLVVWLVIRTYVICENSANYLWVSQKNVIINNNDNNNKSSLKKNNLKKVFFFWKERMQILQKTDPE